MKELNPSEALKDGFYAWLKLESVLPEQELHTEGFAGEQNPVVLSDYFPGTREPWEEGNFRWRTNTLFRLENGNFYGFMPGDHDPWDREDIWWNHGIHAWTWKDVPENEKTQKFVSLHEDEADAMLKELEQQADEAPVKVGECISIHPAKADQMIGVGIVVGFGKMKSRDWRRYVVVRIVALDRDPKKRKWKLWEEERPVFLVRQDGLIDFSREVRHIGDLQLGGIYAVTESEMMDFPNRCSDIIAEALAASPGTWTVEKLPFRR